MAKTPNEHVGSGLDKPDPKTLLEKAKDGIRSVLPKAGDAGSTPSAPVGKPNEMP